MLTSHGCASTALCRVDEVQQTVAALTGVPQSDQILTCNGAPLAAGKPLAAVSQVGQLLLFPRLALLPQSLG